MWHYVSRKKSLSLLWFYSVGYEIVLCSWLDDEKSDRWNVVFHWEQKVGWDGSRVEVTFYVQPKFAYRNIMKVYVVFKGEVWLYVRRWYATSIPWWNTLRRWNKSLELTIKDMNQSLDFLTSRRSCLTSYFDLRCGMLYKMIQKELYILWHNE